MINLLPEERKQNIRAARMNVLLLRYNILVLAAIAVMALVCVGFYFFLQTERNNALATNSDNSKQEAALTSVKQAADSYRTNLTTAKQILDNSIDYTGALIAITKLIPTGVVLDGIDLSPTSFDQQDTFSAHATTYAAALQLKQNFQSSTLFSNVYIETISDGTAGTSTSDSSSTDNKYPITVSISAKLSKAEAF